MINTSNAKSFNNLIYNFDIYIYIIISFISLNFDKARTLSIKISLFTRYCFFRQ